MTNEEMATELREMVEYLGFKGSYRQTLQKIADRLDPPPVMVPVTEAHVGCPVVRTFSAGALLFPRDTDPQSFAHPERYKIAITHRHDESAKCPVDPETFVVVEYEHDVFEGKIRRKNRGGSADNLNWALVKGYSIIDVVPLQEDHDET